MGKYGAAETPILVEAFGPPTAAVELGQAIDNDGNAVASAGVEIAGVANDDFDAADIARNASNVTKLKVPAVTLGIARVLLGGNATKGSAGAVMANGKFQNATAGQRAAVVFREGGASGDLVEAFVLPTRRGVASAAITSPTGGATVDAEARTAIDAIRTVLTAWGITL